MYAPCTLHYLYTTHTPVSEYSIETSQPQKRQMDITGIDDTTKQRYDT